MSLITPSTINTFAENSAAYCPDTPITDGAVALNFGVYDQWISIAPNMIYSSLSVSAQFSSGVVGTSHLFDMRDSQFYSVSGSYSLSLSLFYHAGGSVNTLVEF